jgi:hypothetical protein
LIKKIIFQAEMTTTISPEQLKVSKALEATANQTRVREMENVLEVSLAKLLITCPEDVMFFVMRENFGCKDLKRALRTFSSNYVGDLNSELVFVRLFRSVGKFYQLLCSLNDEKYRRIFTPCQDELVKLHEEFVGCQGSLDWYEKNSTIACDEANRIIECYHRAMSFDVSAKTTHHFIEVFKQIITEALTSPCQFHKMRENENFGDGTKFDWMFIVGVSILIVVLIIVIVIIRMKIFKKYQKV